MHPAPLSLHGEIPQVGSQLKGRRLREPRWHLGDCILVTSVCGERGTGSSHSLSYSDTCLTPKYGCSLWDSGFPWSGLSVRSGTLGYLQILAVPLTGCIILDMSLDQFLGSLSFLICEVG